MKKSLICYAPPLIATAVMVFVDPAGFKEWGWIALLIGGSIWTTATNRALAD